MFKYVICLTQVKERKKNPNTEYYQTEGGRAEHATHTTVLRRAVVKTTLDLMPTCPSGKTLGLVKSSHMPLLLSQGIRLSKTFHLKNRLTWG